MKSHRLGRNSVCSFAVCPSVRPSLPPGPSGPFDRPRGPSERPGEPSERPGENCYATIVSEDPVFI